MEGQQKGLELETIPPSTSKPDTPITIEVAPALNDKNKPPETKNTSPYNTPDGRPPYYRWVVLFISTISILLVSIQQNALIVALPAVIDGLDASLTSIIWVLLAFSMFIASLTIAQGGLSDLMGRCRIYNSGFIFFVIGSLLCGLSEKGKGGWDLVGYRIIQAYGGTALFSNSGSILTDAFVPYKQVGLAMGVNQVASAFGSILGPLLGGVMANIWRWIFYMNVPIGGVAVILSLIFIKDRPRPGQEGLSFTQLWKSIGSDVYHTFDWIGAFFSFAWVACFLLSLTSSAAIPTLPEAAWIALYPVAAVCFVLFVLNEKYFVKMWKRPKTPLLHLSLFTDRVFVLANCGSFLGSMSRIIVLVLSILFLQGPYMEDPYMAGIMTMPLGVGILVSGLFAGTLSDKIGRKLLQIFGPFVAAIGTIGLALVQYGTNYWLFAFALFVTGIGHALYNSPNSASVMLNVPATSRGVASGVRIFLAMLGNSVGMILAFAVVIKQLSIQDLLILFLYGETDASKIPADLDLATLNTTIVHSLSAGFWIGFACIVCAGLCSLALPGKFVVRNSYAATEIRGGVATATVTPKPA